MCSAVSWRLVPYGSILLLSSLLFDKDRTKGHQMDDNVRPTLSNEV